MMNCDDIAFNALLDDDGELESQDPAITRHIESCEQCQDHLSDLAADAEQWDAAQHWLSPGEIPGEAMDSEYEELDDARERWGRPDIWNDTMAESLLSPARHPEMLGRIGRYDVAHLIGSGGMGVVLKAHDTELNRPVAVKLLAPYLASNGAARSRFSREARAAAAVVDDHVVPIHNVETENKNPFLVMKYIGGGSLQQRLDREGPLDVCEVLRIGMQSAKGLAAAHSQGLIHRDIKPANILLDEGVERALLTDFGLARASDDASLTRSGFHPGTPHYMSPEQVRGEAIDARSDLFGLGCVLYALCTGHPPFRSETSYGVLRRVTDDTPRAIREINPSVPDWLEGIVMKLLAKTAGDRFESAQEVADLLEACLAHVQQPTATKLPEYATSLASSRGRVPPALRIAAAAAFAFSLILAGVFIVLELNKGTLTIESDLDDVPIRITQGTEVVERLTVSQAGTTTRISAGTYQVELDGEFGALMIQNSAVTLSRGGREVVRLVRADTQSGTVEIKPYQLGADRSVDLAEPSTTTADGAIALGGIESGQNVRDGAYATSSGLSSSNRLAAGLGWDDANGLRAPATANERLGPQHGSVADALRRFDDAASSFPQLADGIDTSSNPASKVPFVLGHPRFNPGDHIEIQSVTSTGKGFEIGATVTVTGTYTLQSNDEAQLAFYSTVALEPGEKPVGTPVQASQKMQAKKGTHTFTLSKRITSKGSPYISFYHPKSGQGMGGVYFAHEKDTDETELGVSSPGHDLKIRSDATTGNMLNGTWGIEIESPGKPKRSGFAAFAGSSGMIAALDDDTEPLRFSYVIQPRGQRWWIDMYAASGADNGGPSVWHGVVEVSGSSIALCFARADQVQRHGRPVSIDEADPDVFNKVVFVRNTTESPKDAASGVPGELSVPPTSEVEFGIGSLRSDQGDPIEIEWGPSNGTRQGGDAEVDDAETANVKTGDSADIEGTPREPIEMRRDAGGNEYANAIQPLLGSWRVMSIDDQDAEEPVLTENIVLSFDPWKLKWSTEPDEEMHFIHRPVSEDSLSFVFVDESDSNPTEGNLSFSFPDADHDRVEILWGKTETQSGSVLHAERIKNTDEISTYVSRLVAVDVSESYGWAEEEVVNTHLRLIRSPAVLGSIHWPDDLELVPREPAKRDKWLKHGLLIETTKDFGVVIGMHGHITTKDSRERIVQAVVDAYQRHLAKVKTDEGKETIAKLLQKHDRVIEERRVAESDHRSLLEDDASDKASVATSRTKLEQLNDSLSDLCEQLLGYGVPRVSGWFEGSLERAEFGVRTGVDKEIRQVLSNIDGMNRLEDSGPNSSRSPLWGSELRSLVQFGSQAVPNISRELDRTRDDRMIATLAFALRTIGDKRGVPALIRAIPRTSVPVTKCNWIQSRSVIDPELIAFFRGQKFNGQGAAIGCSDAPTELSYALIDLTGQKFGFSRVFGTGMPRQRYFQRQALLRDANRWAKWWNANSADYVDDTAFRTVGLPIDQTSVPKRVAQGELLKRAFWRTRNQLQAISVLAEKQSNARTAFLDLDTGISSPVPEQWRGKTLSKSDRKTMFAWAEKEGFDLTCDDYKSSDGQTHYVLRGIGLEAWQINQDQWETQGGYVSLSELQENGRQATSDWILPFNEETKAPDPTATAPFVCLTRLGSPVLIYAGAEITGIVSPDKAVSRNDLVAPTGFVKGRKIEIGLFESLNGLGKNRSLAENPGGLPSLSPPRFRNDWGSVDVLRRP